MQRAHPPMVERRPLSTGAAARVAGVHSTTIWRAIREGELPAIRLGPHGDYRIRLEALEAWLLPAHNPATTKERNP